MNPRKQAMNESCPLARLFPARTIFVLATAIVLCGQTSQSADPDRPAAPESDLAEFNALDRDGNGRITLDDLVDRETAPSVGAHLSSTVAIAREERAMRLEDALAAADDNRDGAVSPQEFTTHRIEFVAGVQGKPPPHRGKGRAPAATSQSIDAVPLSDWRVAGLIAGNVLLLTGFAWKVRKRAFRDVTRTR
jgi:hypothetical protein